MFSRCRENLGTAGLVVAVVALIAALAGGAYAASGGLTGKQKNEVKSIAKSVAKKGPKGDTGATGTAGPAGPKGDAGAAGQAGGPGVAGKSVVIGNTAPGCAEGGKSVEVEGSPATKKEICNGEEGAPGSPWTVGNELPTKATLTGVFSSSRYNGEYALSISFPVALPAPLPSSAGGTIVTYNGATPTEKEKCDNGTGTAPSVNNPEADAGYLCLFIGFTEDGAAISGGTKAPNGNAGQVSRAGAVMELVGGAEAIMFGSYAVTAP